MTDRERRLHAAGISIEIAAWCVGQAEAVGALHAIRPDLQRRVERLRGSLRRLAHDLGRELERGGTTDTTDTGQRNRT